MATTKELQERIHKVLLAKGVTSEKSDILSPNPEEEKVFVKRINIGKDFGKGPNAVEVSCVSITSGTPFEVRSDVPSIKNVRINTKNSQGEWCNIYLNEAPKELLEFVEQCIKPHRPLNR